MGYIENQIEKIANQSEKTKTEPKIKFSCEGVSSHWINISKEQLNLIKEVLKGGIK